MKFTKEAEKLYAKLEEKEIDGKVQYFKLRKVYPIFNKDGSMNWFNFVTGGKWWKLGLIILFTLVALGFIYEYSSNLKHCAEVMTQLNIQKNMTLIFP